MMLNTLRKDKIGNGKAVAKVISRWETDTVVVTQTKNKVYLYDTSDMSNYIGLKYC